MEQKISVLPYPKKAELFGGKADFHDISINTNVPEWNRHISLFNDCFQSLFGTNSGSVLDIGLAKDEKLRKGAYIIDFSDKYSIYASDEEGAFYAAATLIQLIEKSGSIYSVPKLRIEDYPDRDFRALMVDLARHWHPAEEVLKYIDICFLFKIKYLHLHFIDNERYTLPSHSFPKLPDSNESYSAGDIKRITDYAAARGIIIIPETEVPGHAEILNKAYPNIFNNKCSGDSEAFITEGGAVIEDESIVCAGSRTAEEAIKQLISEAAGLFPNSPYLHIGGDEADIKVWEKCSVCKKYMEENGIGDANELYSDFVARIAKHVLAIGKTPIVWEGFGKSGARKIPKETLVISWESYYHLPSDLLEEGFRIINASWQPLYIVPAKGRFWSPMDVFNWNIFTWRHWWEKSKASKAPVVVPPTEKVIGGMICSWESDFKRDISVIKENITAFSEKTWNIESNLTENEFLSIREKSLIITDKIINA